MRSLRVGEIWAWAYHVSNEPKARHVWKIISLDPLKLQLLEKDEEGGRFTPGDICDDYDIDTMETAPSWRKVKSYMQECPKCGQQRSIPEDDYLCEVCG